ncbi:MAG: YaaA family protein, partial [Alistipes sp.]|nr:YaaA family protein [Alistipes sp.]
LRVNLRIAAENHLRYRRFHDGDTPALPALAAYTGIVFKRIGPADFSAADFEYAQEHLNITSFLYGLLRPLDAIRPYRLEGDAVLPGHDEETVFAYWHERLTDALLDKIRRDDGILVNLASGEMKRLFDWRRICREVRVITPEFRIREGDRLKTIVIYTKMCRGEMTRHILKNRITDPEALQAFEWEGFRFDPSLSRGDDWTFTM